LLLGDGAAHLPGAREFNAIIKTAVAKSAADIANPPAVKRRSAKPLPDMPADLSSALARKPKALKQFKAFAPTHRREYLNWVIEAKREETRRKRIAEIITRLLDVHQTLGTTLLTEFEKVASTSSSVARRARERGRKGT
jgi:uncharacterized protein YdeI (YjbR/CyaY-like superfamily)